MNTKQFMGHLHSGNLSFRKISMLLTFRPREWKYQGAMLEYRMKLIFYSPLTLMTSSSNLDMAHSFYAF